MTITNQTRFVLAALDDAGNRVTFGKLPPDPVGEGFVGDAYSIGWHKSEPIILRRKVTRVTKTRLYVGKHWENRRKNFDGRSTVRPWYATPEAAKDAWLLHKANQTLRHLSALERAAVAFRNAEKISTDDVHDWGV